MKFIEKIYFYLRLIRRSEQRIIDLYPNDHIKSPVHLSIGQEHIAVGVALATKPDDFIFSFYRSHAHYIAHNGDIKQMWAELYGKLGGSSDGKGGSMHLGDLNAQFAYTSAIVSTQIPNAVGYAFAKKMRGESGTVICYLGDGATEEGVFWESLNFAALKSLPILFICENNHYAIYAHQSARQAQTNICQKVQSFGIKSFKAKDNSTIGIYKQCKKLLKRVKESGAPVFVEFTTSRFRDHVGPGEDRHIKFRPNSELDAAIANDELPKIRATLDKQTADSIDLKVENLLNDAIAYAIAQPYPSEIDMYKNVTA